MTMPPASILVLGLGNDILGDDAVGLHVARAVGARVASVADCSVRETTEMGLALLDEIVGCEHLLLVDAIETGSAQPGHVHEFGLEALGGHRIATPHFVGIAETLAVGRMLGLTMPRTTHIFAIEVRDPYTLRLSLTPEVEQAVDVAADRICSRVIQLTQSGCNNDLKNPNGRLVSEQSGQIDGGALPRKGALR